MKIVSSFQAFPGISWWVAAVKADTILLDAGEYFQKMSYRNRYRITGSNNSILLSVPLVDGRNQRIPMGEVRIHNGERWQTQHWRSLVSVYKRAPFFDHYEDSLRPLFDATYSKLIDFDRESVLWVKRQLKLDMTIEETDTFINQYPSEVRDLRFGKTKLEYFPKYYQVFEDRIGFLPDMSILDLLFSEGPAAARLLSMGVLSI